jgi:hypothetical protein
VRKGERMEEKQEHETCEIGNNRSVESLTFSGTARDCLACVESSLRMASNLHQQHRLLDDSLRPCVAGL